MGYYFRAFCTSATVPELSLIQTWLRDRDSAAILDDPNHAVEIAVSNADLQPILNLETSDWEQVAIFYRNGKLPILVTCDRNNDDEDNLLREEIEEFIESIESTKDSAGKTLVLEHLRATQFVIACQIPTSNIENNGHDANDDFLSFFVEHCGGMIQADGEGFYDSSGSNLLVPLE